ncbi:MAG: oxygenase MpaB family protein [Candidatus Binatia bacterium]
MVLLLAGGRALLMQLAHPKVAAGVAEHSRFHVNPLGRLYRTMSAMWSIVFDEESQARAALRQVETIHQRVHGMVPPGEPLPAGAAYDASDQALLLWVHATLIDSAMVAYDLFVAPLTAADRQEYYEDSKKLAALFGIQEKNIPSSLTAFDGYMADIVASETIAVGPTARSLAQGILYPHPWLLKPAGPVFRLVTAGMLPEKLRDAYGLKWTGPRAKRLSLAAGAIRGTLPLVPSPLRIVPNARKSERVRRR